MFHAERGDGAPLDHHRRLQQQHHQRAGIVADACRGPAVVGWGLLEWGDLSGGRHGPHTPEVRIRFSQERHAGAHSCAQILPSNDRDYVFAPLRKPPKLTFHLSLLVRAHASVSRVSVSTTRIRRIRVELRRPTSAYVHGRTRTLPPSTKPTFHCTP